MDLVATVAPRNFCNSYAVVNTPSIALKAVNQKTKVIIDSDALMIANQNKNK